MAAFDPGGGEGVGVMDDMQVRLGKRNMTDTTGDLDRLALVTKYSSSSPLDGKI